MKLHLSVSVAVAMLSAACGSDTCGSDTCGSDTSATAAASDATSGAGTDVGQSGDTGQADGTTDTIDGAGTTDATDGTGTTDATDGSDMTDMTDSTDGMSVVEPSAESAALYAAIAEYQAWSKFPELQVRTKSATHMNNWVMAYYNDKVQQSMTSGQLPLPVGSIIVKENFMGETDAMPMALTVMQKTAGGWYWLQATPAGKVLLAADGSPMEGPNVSMCLMCHHADTNDAVMLHSFASTK